MNKEETLPIHARTRSFLETKGSGTLLGILAVFVPFGLVGWFGESLGGGSALSNVVLILAYALGIGIATLVIRQWGWSWRGLGLGRPVNTRRTVFQAISTTVIAVVAVIIPQIIVLLLVGPAGPASNQSEYNPIRGNLPMLLAALVVAWTNVAFGEEMVFRGFLINALSRLFRQTRVAVAMAVVGSSIIFGLAHFAWGWIGVLETTLFGLVLGIAYVRSGRNLWVTLIAHGLANTLKFLLIYSGAV
jgi:membrane protease YdiL (CAAX protease family)